MSKYLVNWRKKVKKRSIFISVFSVLVIMLAFVVMPVQAKGKLVTLGAGTYKVGEDIKPGRYIITSTNGSGNVTDSKDLNIILGESADDDGGQIDSYTTYLPKGDKVKIEGIESTVFTPVKKRKKMTTLHAGSWIVGKDIKPGTYTIKCVQGSGNLTTDDGDINEIIGTSADDDSGQVTKVRAHLTKGQELTTDAEEIELIKK